jgi:hypothetical protein
MLINTAYLLVNRLADGLGWGILAVGETSLPKLFQGMVLVHTAVGLLLTVLMLAFFGAHLPKVWKRRHTASVMSGSLYLLAGLTLAVTGLFILTAAASRDNAWAWWAHVVCAALVVIGFVTHRLVSYSRPPGVAFRRFGLGVAVGVSLLLVAHGFTNRDIELTVEAREALERGLGSGPGAKSRDVADFANGAFVAKGFVPPESPFFPSPATTTSGGYLPARIITRDVAASLSDDVAEEIARHGFVIETPIGAETCIRCHPDIVEQWAASSHRFASFNNPFYEATIEDMRRNATVPNASVEAHMRRFSVAPDGVGRVKSKFCSGCHDPALMLAGRMDGEIDRASVEAQAGLTCLACHAIDLIHDRTGNGNYNIADEQEDPYLFAGAEPGTWEAFLHDAALKAKPTVHRRQLSKPFFREPEFCATCHKVSLTEPVNNYRWLRGQDEFDNWHDSGVSLNASRTFYLPEERLICQDCHMPLEPAPRGDVSAKRGMVRSHRFLAVNTALPFVRGDDETIRRIEAFLRDEKLSVDIFAIRTGRTGESTMSVDSGTAVLVPGERLSVDVVVRNKGVGHTFPGGTNDSNEAWLEMSLLDSGGEVLAVSGAVGEDGHLDPMAHVYKSVVLDRHGNLIDRRNASDIHVTAATNVIGPGTADVGHFELVVPAEMAGKALTLRARLLWRKFDRRYTEFAFGENPEGFKRFKNVPDLPITEIASDELELRVMLPEDQGAPPIQAEETEEPSEWTRYNDYGIALLREGNTRAALRAFERVAELQPERIDGPLNMARAALQEGNIEASFEYLHTRKRPWRIAACWRISPRTGPRGETSDGRCT